MTIVHFPLSMPVSPVCFPILTYFTPIKFTFSLFYIASQHADAITSAGNVLLPATYMDTEMLISNENLSKQYPLTFPKMVCNEAT